MSGTLLLLEWSRPFGLLLLAWWIPLWILLRRKDRPRTVAIGTLDLWRDVGASSDVEAQRRSARIPPRAWLWILGILAGALAVTEPVRSAQPSAPLQRVFVDRSPSMYLPFEAQDSRTRYDVALELVLEDFDERDVSAQAREWQAAGTAVIRAAQPPASWSLAPRVAMPELDAALLHRGDLYLMTDVARESQAGLFASGGAAIPGLVGEWQGRALNWDGIQVQEGRALDPQGLHVIGELPAELAQLLTIWAAERGLERTGDAHSAALVIRVPSSEPTRPCRASRDEWSLEGRSGAIDEAADVWLRDDAGHALLSLPQPGEIVCGLRSVETLGGDPAAWAVSWARLFDAALLPRASLVSLTERQAAGAQATRPAQGAAPPVEVRSLPAAAWLAIFTLLAALAAFFPRSRPGGI